MKTKKLKTACLLTFGLMTSTAAVASVVSCGSKTESEAPAPNPNPSHPDSESNPNPEPSPGPSTPTPSEPNRPVNPPSPELTLNLAFVGAPSGNQYTEGNLVKVKVTPSISQSNLTYSWKFVGSSKTHITNSGDTATFIADAKDNGKSIEVSAIKGDQPVYYYLISVE